MPPKSIASPPPTNGAYQDRIRTQFAALKGMRRFDDLMSASIRLKDDAGYLLCVSELHYDDDEIITLLGKWREEAITFHNKFPVTFEGTKRWLRKLLLDIPDRILHLGFAGALNEEGLMEFDNVVRGVQKVRPGIMALATQAVLAWAQATFEPRGFYLKTLDNNTHAIQFYERLGFRRAGQYALRRVQSGQGFDHVPVPAGDANPPDRYFVRMNYEPGVRLAAPGR